MKYLANILRLSALALFCGCGGGGEGGGGGGGASGPPASGDLNITGNWQFNTTSAVQGTAPLGLAGSITQSDSSLNGAVHVDGSNCLDPLTTVSLTGTLNGSTVSLTSGPVDGQVIALTGSITNGLLTGTYTISGGCANDDQGSLNGFKIPAISGRWRGRTIVNDQTGTLTLTLTQGNVNADGSFGLSGSASNATYFGCDEGTITSGTLTTSGSWIIGTRVFLQIQNTNGGKANFFVTANQTGTVLQGGLGYVDGPCEGNGGEATFTRS